MVLSLFKLKINLGLLENNKIIAQYISIIANLFAKILINRSGTDYKPLNVASCINRDDRKKKEEMSFKINNINRQ